MRKGDMRRQETLGDSRHEERRHEETADMREKGT